MPKGKPNIPRPEAPRFWKKVNKAPGLGPEGDCWEWQGAKNPKGYGQFHSKLGSLAHRIAFQLTSGELDKSLLVCHKCDNPSCVRPEHLFVGTVQDNTNDMIAKGRQVLVTKTICKRGHKLAGENLHVSPTGKRTCLKCRELYHAEFLAANGKSYAQAYYEANKDKWEAYKPAPA